MHDGAHDHSKLTSLTHENVFYVAQVLLPVAVGVCGTADTGSGIAGDKCTPVVESVLALVRPLPNVPEETEPHCWITRSQVHQLIVLPLVPSAGQVCVMLAAVLLSVTPGLPLGD